MPFLSRQAARLVRACAVLCFGLSSATAYAQEYYGVPIEDGGVAFLLDVSGSMAEATPARVPASALDPEEAWRSGTRQSTGRRTATSVPHTSKMEAARRELLHALSSLRDGTNFTIITFGNGAAEWPGGVSTMGSSAIARARGYVARMSAAGGTPMAEALELGFRVPNVRTLFVVSDGRPTTGDVLRVVAQLQESRRGRRMVINTVGIGPDQDATLLCQLALDNEGVYVRDREVACTFSPCSPNDGLVTFYPPEAIQTPRVTRICSTHSGCTPESVFETMVSEARRHVGTRDRTNTAHCFELDGPHPSTVVIHDDGLEVTTYTRPGHASHPGKVTRIVKRDGDDVMVETTGAGKLRPSDFEDIDRLLIEALHEKLASTPEADVPAKKEIEPLPKKPESEALPKKKPPVGTKKKP